MSWGEKFNWQCDICGKQDFNKDEDYFVGHRWDCLELQDYEDVEEDE